MAQIVGLFSSFGFHRLSSEIDVGFFGDLENTDGTFIGCSYQLTLGQ